MIVSYKCFLPVEHVREGVENTMDKVYIFRSSRREIPEQVNIVVIHSKIISIDKVAGSCVQTIVLNNKN